jgi:DNA-binding NarL/FixJ family response regulator
MATMIAQSTLPHLIRRKLEANERKRQAILREREELIKEASKAGASAREIAAPLGISHPTVTRLLSGDTQSLR